MRLPEWEDKTGKSATLHSLLNSKQEISRDGIMHSDSLCVVMKLFITGVMEVSWAKYHMGSAEALSPRLFWLLWSLWKQFFRALEWSSSVEIGLQRTGRTSQGTRKTLLLLTETGIVCLLRLTPHGREQLGLRGAGFGITPSLPPTCRRLSLRGALTCEDACAHQRHIRKGTE